MEHMFTKRSEDEESVLVLLFKYRNEGLTRQKVADKIQKMDVLKITSLLRQLEAGKLVTAVLSMVLDGIDPDDVSCWSISDIGSEYLKEHRLQS